jgi:hypothetical protein
MLRLGANSQLQERRKMGFKAGKAQSRYGINLTRLATPKRKRKRRTRIWTLGEEIRVLETQLAKLKREQARRRALRDLRALEGRVRARKRRFKLSAPRVLVCRMEPGAWYTLGDVGRLLPEYTYGSVAWVLGGRAWQSSGLFERALNAEYDATLANNGPRQRQSKWLYGLSAKAIAERPAWRQALGMEFGSKACLVD